MRKSKVYDLTDDEFVELIKNSYNFSDVCKQLGLSINGSNGRNQIKKRCEQLNIDYSHFLLNKKRAPDNSHPKYSLEEILVENSTYSNRTSLKRRIINANLIPYECALCKNTGEWLGNPLSLQIDHINGINNDNRLENLRFLCPNCHSQTDTFSGKNKTTSC